MLSLKTRLRAAAAINLLIVLPLLPTAMLLLFFEGGAAFLKWLMDGRWLLRQLDALTRKVDKAFGVDQETLQRDYLEPALANALEKMLKVDLDELSSSLTQEYSIM